VSRRFFVDAQAGIASAKPCKRWRLLDFAETTVANPWLDTIP
jgi:hypothetical protein